MPAKKDNASKEEYAAGMAASLSRILTGYAVDTQLELQRQAGTSRVAGELASFASDMASVAANPASEMERLTASVAASIAFELASFSRSFAASIPPGLAGLTTGYAATAHQLRLQKPGSTSRVAGELASFASDMASVAANPASEMERLTASVAASISSELASFARSLELRE